MYFTFQIGKYNEKVAVQYALPYDPSTLAFIVFSTPAMFDRTFKPFIRRQPSDQLEEPIDQCMIHHFNLVKEVCWQFICRVYESILFIYIFLFFKCPKQGFFKILVYKGSSVKEIEVYSLYDKHNRGILYKCKNNVYLQD